MLLQIDGRNIYYDLLGMETGDVICFSHSLAADSGMWAEQVPVLIREGFRVLRIDLRGHGGSDAVPGDYTMEDLADDVLAVLDALDIAQVHFAGLSIGGHFGQAFALRHCARLKSLILCDTHPASPADAQERWNPRIAAVRRANSLEPIADDTMGRWLTDHFKQVNPIRWKQIRDSVVGTRPQGYYGCVAAILNFDYRKQLPTITAPTIVICGAGDPGAPTSGNKLIAELIPNARYEEIAGARHFPNVEFPEVFNSILMEWLSSVK